jgi:uncharacterized membrane protein
LRGFAAMITLIAGLAVFLAAHSVRLVADDWRSHQIARIGPGRWKLAYSAISLASLLLIIHGYGVARMNPVVLWEAPGWARHVAALLTVVGFVLVAAAYVPGTHIKSLLGHPMTAGVALWAIGHLLANGRLSAVILFGAFLAWSVILFVARRRHDREAGVVHAGGSLARDAIAVAIGFVAAIVFALYMHGPLIGVRPFG